MVILPGRTPGCNTSTAGWCCAFSVSGSRCRVDSEPAQVLVISELVDVFCIGSVRVI